MDPDPVAPADPTLGRRTVLAGGVASIIGLGAAACAPDHGPPPGRAAPTAQAMSQAASPAASGTAGRAAVPGGSPAQAAAAPTILSTPGPDIRSGPSRARSVALTFHGAGAPDLTREVLRVCAERHARITVFAVGTWLVARPDLGGAIVAAGHDLGNHTWSHQTMTRLSASEADAEVRDGARAVAAIAGSSPLLFRPSGTQTSTATIRAAAARSGYARCISYDVDPEDYTDPGADQVATRTLAAVQPGSIVSLHLGHAGTVAALPAILDGLARRSLDAVALTTLLA